MRSRGYLKFALVVVIGLAAISAIAQTYTAVPLPPPKGYEVINLFHSINNKGQVLGEAGNLQKGIRFPVLWTKAIPRRLSAPVGYTAISQEGYYWKVNDAGTVIGPVADANNTAHIAQWMGSSVQVLPEPPSDVVCGQPNLTGISSYPFGINRAGHILGWTIYEYGSCYGFWIYNSGTWRGLPNPVPPQCNLTEVYTDQFYIGINDADQVVVNVDNQNGSCTNFPAYDPAIIQPDGSYTFIPEGNNLFRAKAINNLGMVTGDLNYGAPGGIGVWDPVLGLTYLGDNTAAGAPNNVGQVVYSTYLGNDAWQTDIWQNGTSSPIQGQNLPSGIPMAFNDAGQITEPWVGLWLLTPSGPCATDVSSQVKVTRGPLQYDSSTGHYNQLVTVKNTSLNTITGPLSVALKSLTPAASLFNTEGATSCSSPAGSAYTNFPATSLAPGTLTSVTLEFIDTAQGNVSITYGPQILAGAGTR